MAGPAPACHPQTNRRRLDAYSTPRGSLQRQYQATPLTPPGSAKEEHASATSQRTELSTLASATSRLRSSGRTGSLIRLGSQASGPVHPAAKLHVTGGHGPDAGAGAHLERVRGTLQAFGSRSTAALAAITT